MAAVAAVAGADGVPSSRSPASAVRSQLTIALMALLTGCDQPPQRSYPRAALEAEQLPLAGLRDRSDWPEQFNVDGFVVFRTACPPCPEGALCEPCSPESVVLSARSGARGAFEVGDSGAVVYLNDPHQLELGGKYRVTMSHHPECWSVACPDFQLIGYSALE